MTTPNKKTGIVVECVEDISPHNKALYEAGKALLLESVGVGREFCKFMTTTSFAAIPAYIALLKLVLPQDYAIQPYDDAFFLVPPFLFLVSSIVFVLGYFPQKGHLSLDIPAEIERERKVTITRRHRYAMAGFAVLCIGIVSGTLVLIGRMKS